MFWIAILLSMLGIVVLTLLAAAFVGGGHRGRRKDDVAFLPGDDWEDI
jgi:hypothetical protein